MDYEYRKKIEGEQWMKTTEEQAKKNCRHIMFGKNAWKLCRIVKPKTRLGLNTGW